LAKKKPEPIGRRRGEGKGACPIEEQSVEENDAKRSPVVIM
jgi:hypothetical protein